MKKQEAGCRTQDSADGSREQVLHSASAILHPDMLQRVHWRCRRGLLELDIVLGRFVETHYANLTESERQIFEVFLDMPDNPLWDLLSGRQGEVSGEQAVLLEKIKSV